MKKNTPLYILLIFLIIVNGFFLFNFLGKSHDKRNKGPKGPRNFMVKELRLDDSQKQQFEKLTASHRELMRTYDDDIRVLKDEFFSRISNEAVQTLQIDSIAGLISQREKQKDLELFKHFRELRAICNDEQKARFSSIIKDALHKRGRRGRHGRSRGERPPR